jgi:hypothetical protein
MADIVVSYTGADRRWRVLAPRHVPVRPHQHERGARLRARRAFRDRTYSAAATSANSVAWRSNKPR